MSQEPATDDFQEDDVKEAQDPMYEVRETDPDEEAEVGSEEDVLDAEDIEELEPPEPDFRTDVTRQTDTVMAPQMVASTSREEIIRALRMVREDVGQICELSGEEEKIVEAFCLALLRLMKPLAKAIPVDPSALPRTLGDVEKANIIPEGDLIVLYSEGGMESIDLSSEANRDLLVDVIRNVMPKFIELIAELRAKIESRMGLLASVTGELQNIADAFSSAIG